MVSDRAYFSTKNQNLLKFCFKKKPFAVYIRVSEALEIFFGGIFNDYNLDFYFKKNGFNDYSPENRGSYGELRRSGKAMHVGKIDPAPRCGGFFT